MARVRAFPVVHTLACPNGHFPLMDCVFFGFGVVEQPTFDKEDCPTLRSGA
jgi:hypothetical protein